MKIYEGDKGVAKGKSVSSTVEDRVEEIVRQLTAGSELEVVDVEFVKEHEQYLRVFIDKESGIGIGDCQALSEKLEEELDREDFIPGAYILEVSSPGLDRVLRKDRDFVREAGKAVEVSLYEPVDGKKTIVGRLAGLSEDKSCLRLEGESPESLREIRLGKIARVRLHIEI